MKHLTTERGKSKFNCFFSKVYDLFEHQKKRDPFLLQNNKHTYRMGSANVYLGLHCSSFCLDSLLDTFQGYVSVCLCFIFMTNAKLVVMK